MRTARTGSTGSCSNASTLRVRPECLVTDARRSSRAQRARGGWSGPSAFEVALRKATR
jgi:hypothetical protein